MCLTVDYYCICGVVARTTHMVCSAPVPLRSEKTHHVQLSMILPREEWNARQGICPQRPCPQNGTSTSSTDVKTKCPGCSNLCGNNGAIGFDDFEEELEKELERSLINMDVDDDSGDSDDGFEKELARQLELKLSDMDVELDVNQAVFLDRAVWDTHHCPVEFCPFNMGSMNRANEKLAALVGEMQHGAEDPVKWTPEDDDQILDLASQGADDELIANTVGRAVADIHERLAYLRILSEVLE